MLFMNKPMPEYTVKLYDTCPWIIEHIDASFDDVLCNLDPNGSYIYGGAVRDILAGLPLVGDLDIIVEQALLKRTVDTFRCLPRWDLREVTDGAKYAKQLALSKEKTPHSSMPTIATFYDSNGTKLQIISPSDNVSNILDTIPCSRSAWDIARLVDIRCSGIISTLNGDIYEAVTNAVDDCRNRVLVINPVVKNTVDNNHLHTRVEKLIARGWKSNINLEEYPIITAKPNEAIGIF